MDSELKSIFLKLGEVNKENQNNFYDMSSFDLFGLDSAFSSVRDFVDVYKEKNYSIFNRGSCSWRSFIKADCLELLILTMCSDDNSFRKFIDEILDISSSNVNDDDFFDIDYVIDYLNDLTFSKEKIASWYIKLLEKNNVGMQTSRIFNDPINVNLFSKEQLEIIKKYKKKMSVLAMREYEKFINLSSEDIEFEDVNEKLLFDYMIVNFENEDNDLKEKREKVIEKIVNNIFYASNLQKEFVVRMAAFEKCKKNNLPLVNIVFSDDIDALGSYFSKSNIIDVYDNRLRNINNMKELTKMIDVIEHEVEHYLQSVEFYNGSFSLPAYSLAVNDCLNDYLNLGEYNDYRNNYNYREIEKYARINGLNDACAFISKYYNGDLIFLNEYRENAQFKELQYDSLGYHLDGDNNFESRGFYNIKTMCELFSKEPAILNRYPILKKFFSSNGRLKEWTELSRDYLSLKEDEKVIYSDVCDYLFSNSYLFSNVSFDMAESEDVKLGFISMLKDDLSRKINQLFLIGKKIDKINTNDVKGMDEKKYCYDVFDKYVDSINMEYKFLIDNSLNLDSSSYVENIEDKIRLVLESNFTMYPESKKKLESICNYQKNEVIEDFKKL